MCEQVKYNKKCGKCDTILYSDLKREGAKCKEVKDKGKNWGECNKVKTVTGTDVTADDVTSSKGARCFTCINNERLQPVDE